MSDFIPKQELTLMFKSVDNKIENYHKEVMAELKQHRATHEQLLEQVKFTNGKVRKIIIALVAVGAFVLGTSGESIIALFKLFI